MVKSTHLDEWRTTRGEAPLKRTWLLIGFCGLTALVVGCTSPNERKHNVARADVLAEVGSRLITKKDFDLALKRLSPSVRKQYRSLKRKAQFLEQLIHFELMVLEARRLGLQHAGWVKRIKQRAMSEMLIKRIAQRLRPSAVTTKEMRDYYRKQYHSFNQPEKRRIQQIFFRVAAGATPAQWADKHRQIKAMMSSIQKENQKRGGFASLVKRYSDDPHTKHKLGDLGSSARSTEGGRWDASLSRLVFSMKQRGDIAGPYRSKDGFHVFRLAEIKPAVRLSFANAQATIQRRLLKHKRTQAYHAYVKTLRKKYTIKVDQNVLMKVAPVPASKHPAPRKPAPAPILLDVVSPTPTSRPVSQPTKPVQQPPASRPASQPNPRK
jgi:hypothetical protein